MSNSATRLLLLGSGELGKELAIEAQRLGIEVIAVDRYAQAPAMQVAHRAYALNMLDGNKLRRVIEREKPHYIVPELEAIDTAELEKLEDEGWHVVPTAKAARLTMDREAIRTIASKELGFPTSAYRFCGTEEEFCSAVSDLGFPCVVKPVMSSSGKGQSIINNQQELSTAWSHAQSAGRAGSGRAIVESFIDFDFEITLLTIRHQGGTDFCAPIGHRQSGGDYQESWQPQPMSPVALEKAKGMAQKITEVLGGHGIFGAEFFVRDDQVWFSEISPRPHDTGLVTLVSQNLTEFELHIRAILGLPIPRITQRGPAASAAILAGKQLNAPRFTNLEAALSIPCTSIRLFGKPECRGRRRMGVGLAVADNLQKARENAKFVSNHVRIEDGKDHQRQ